MKAQRVGILHVILVVVILIIGAGIWKSQTRKSQNAVSEAVDKKQQDAIAAKAESARLERIEEEKKNFENKLKKEKTSEFEKAIGSLKSIYAKWNDAGALASNTARIALAGPVASLQSIKREANDLRVPDCLDAAKKSLIDGMTHTIDGYLDFMAGGIRELNAATSFRKAKDSFAEFERNENSCTPPA